MVTTIAADVSSYGLGAVLLQRQEDGQDRPVAFASRSVSETEQQYAQVEIEALAINWACEKFADFPDWPHLQSGNRPQATGASSGKQEAG